jgi:hypothetical protein
MAEKATMIGLCRVANQELANVECRFIDLAVPSGGSSFDMSALMNSLIQEVESGSSELIAAYRGRQRWIETFEPIKLDAAPGAAPLREGETYLITGGLSGNGFGLAKYLARTLKARLVLIEDAGPDQTSSLAAEAKFKHIEILKELGAEVSVFEIDITNPDELARAWTEGELRLGAITGVIHAEPSTRLKRS